MIKILVIEDEKQAADLLKVTIWIWKDKQKLKK